LVAEKLRIAVVGMGKMGIVHSCITNVIPDVQLVALCEKSTITRRLLKRVFRGVRIVDDVGKMADLGLDAVFVTTPIAFHFPVAKAIYEKHVARNLFVEKTLASTVEEAKELCQLANSSGGIDMVGYLRRFYVTFSKAKELLSDGVVGEVTSFKAYAYSSDFLGVGNNVAASRGGVLRDLGCHAIDLALWFFGELVVCWAKPASLGNTGPDDLVDFKVKNKDGLEGEFSVSLRVEGYRLPEVGFSVVGSKGNVIVNDDKVELDLEDGKKSTWYRHDLNDNVPFWLALPEYYREDQYFIKSVAERIPAESGFLSAAKVDEIISQVEKKVGEVDGEK
jgi:predicted dehydrogenase